MERSLKVIAILLSRMIARIEGTSLERVLAEAEAEADATKRQVTADDVEVVYAAYPTKCPVRGTPTGKCAKDKERIRRLLKDHSASDLVYTIGRYIDECTRGEVYIKNFGTFLNQLPDYGDESDDLFATARTDKGGKRPQE